MLVPSHPNLEYTFAEASDPGARPYQEDTIRVWQAPSSIASRSRPVLAVLSDGMGGHVSGETASRLAATRYVDIIKSNHSDQIEKLLEQALTLSNDALSEAVRQDAALKGMGCTLVAAYMNHEGLRWVSVGDSALLQYRDGWLSRLNDDHSLGSLLDRQAQANIISYEDAASDPRRRVLRSALVGTPIALADIRSTPSPLEHGDWIIVASDGLETLSGDEICEIMRQKLNDDAHPQLVAKALLDEVRRRKAPAQDNVSIIVIRVSDTDDAETKIVSRRARSTPLPSGGTTQPIDHSSRSNYAGPATVASSALSSDPSADRGATEAVAPQSGRAKSRGGLLRLTGFLALLGALAITYWVAGLPGSTINAPGGTTEEAVGKTTAAVPPQTEKEAGGVELKILPPDVKSPQNATQPIIGPTPSKGTAPSKH